MDIETVRKVFKEIIPIDNPHFYISKMIYGYLKRLAENGDNVNILKDVEKVINDRIRLTDDILKEYEEMEVPHFIGDLHNLTLDAFSCYYEGLTLFKEFLDGSAEKAAQAFEYFHVGDRVLLEIEDAMKVIEAYDLNTVTTDSVA